MERKESIVVIGGGPAGLSLMRKLDKELGSDNFVFVEPREYAEVPFAVLCGLTEPDGLGKSMRKAWGEVTKAKRYSARATEISGNEVVLSTGERILFEQAIVATGPTTSGYPFVKGGTAETITERNRDFAAEASKLRDAASVLIIGGGPIGVELSGEINSAYPEKRIILVAGKDRLLPELKPGVGSKAYRVLSSRGVSIVLGKRLEENGGQHVDADGVVYEADLVYKAIGIRADAIPVDGAESINDSGHLRVERDLRVVGRDNVFAIGDVNDVAEIELGSNARSQAGVVARNVVSLTKNMHAKTHPYKPRRPMGLVTFGRRGGVVQTPHGRMDFMIALKQKDMMVTMYLGKKTTKEAVEVN